MVLEVMEEVAVSVFRVAQEDLANFSKMPITVRVSVVSCPED
jgi:signal transduction histidine kinase